MFTSGYNNVSPGDGNARLYVLERVHRRQARGARTPARPNDPNANGIAKIANWVDDTLIDNSTQYVYAGDLSGNLWKFDISSSNAAQRLGYTSATAGDQPITVKPELGIVKGPTGTEYKAIFFGTGRYLGFSDLRGRRRRRSSKPSIR